MDMCVHLILYTVLYDMCVHMYACVNKIHTHSVHVLSCAHTCQCTCVMMYTHMSVYMCYDVHTRLCETLNKMSTYLQDYCETGPGPGSETISVTRRLSSPSV